MFPCTFEVLIGVSNSLISFLQVYVDKLVKVAYENWENVVEYDGEALVGVTSTQGNRHQNRRSSHNFSCKSPSAAISWF
jgi:hypothetical protein